jgi:FAD/FMN-containing dehydrogenase
MDASQISPLYPRMKDFRALTAEFDSKGRFNNKFLRDHIYAV